MVEDTRLGVPLLVGFGSAFCEFLRDDEDEERERETGTAGPETARR